MAVCTDTEGAQSAVVSNANVIRWFFAPYIAACLPRLVRHRLQASAKTIVYWGLRKPGI